MNRVLSLQNLDTVRLDLDDGWQFAVDPTGRLRYVDLDKVQSWREARAGLSWNVQFEDLRDYMGAAWYRRRIEVPSFKNGHALLKFGAVDYFCEIYINGVLFGSHEGGYTPFSFDITSALHPGENEIAVWVVDPPMNEAENRNLFPEMMYNEIPHGKQSWYVQNSGIWQGVRVEFCPAIYVDRVDLTPQFSGEFLANVRLAGSGFADEGLVTATTLLVTIADSSGKSVFQHSEVLGNKNGYEITGKIPQRKTWSPDNPHLYNVEVSLTGAVNYRRRVRFGFRDFEARDGQLFLNEQPFYMLCTLDQDFYPETIHSPTSVEIIRDMMLKAKRMGVNMLRCHLKVAHPVYLDMADEIGMLVWAEMPSWSDSWFPSDHFSFRAALRGEHMFQEVMLRDWNHPSIVIRTIINESWGINLSDAEQRKWLIDAFDRAKDTLRPLGRLVVDNSACEGNFHLKTDLDDFHMYYSMPDQVKKWNAWLDDFASRPAWTFSPHGDAQRTGKEPLIVSEFGNWGLPLLPLDEQLPWWFEFSFGGRVVTNPAGVFQRFRDYDLGSVFKDYNDFALESQQHQFTSIKYEIESIRAHPSIQGYVLTAMTDVHWEVNGLLDMWRNPKVFATDLENLQQADVVFGIPVKQTVFPQDELSVALFLSHYSQRDLSGAKLRWDCESGQSGSISLQAIVAGEVQAVGEAKWKAPDSDKPFLDRLRLELRGRDGRRIAENYVDVFVIPRVEKAPNLRFTKECEQLAKLVGEGTLESDKSVLVSSHWTAEFAEHLARGGDAILLADSVDAIPSDLSIASESRAGTELDGRWFSNFNWIRPDQVPFRDVAFTRILGFESAAVVPDYVITGIPPANFRDVLCGVTYGWLQLNSGMVLQARVGAGRVIITTLRFVQYGDDAYATTLFDSLARYVCSDSCKPELDLVPVQQQR